jgi:hypothetical protein
VVLGWCICPGREGIEFQQIIGMVNLLQYTTEEPVSDLPGEVQKDGLLNKLSLKLQRKSPQKTY